MFEPNLFVVLLLVGVSGLLGVSLYLKFYLHAVWNALLVITLILILMEVSILYVSAFYMAYLLLWLFVMVKELKDD